MKILFCFLIALISLSACNFKKSNYSNSAIPVTGKIGEILVVCDNDVWNSPVKECLDTNLTQFIMPYFPDVATFELIHKTHKHFTKGIKRYRNMMFIHMDPDYKGNIGKVEKRIGVWATDQIVIDITANSYNQLVETCQKGLGKVHDEFDEFEWKRIKKYYGNRSNSLIDKKVAKNFGIELVLPDGAKLVTTRTNFFRIKFQNASRPIDFGGGGGQDPGTILAGLMIYQYPYFDTSQFDMKNLFQARDTMLYHNVPSDYEGMYMGTQYDQFIYPEGEFTKNASGKLNGLEMRGMFKFVGRGMRGTGGAFWAYHFVNPKTKKLVCVSGYVDAPSTTSWTQSLREIQAVLKSIEIK